MLRCPRGFTDKYVTKESLVEAMFHSNKRQRIEEYPNGVSISTWLRAAQ